MRRSRSLTAALGFGAVLVCPLAGLAAPPTLQQQDAIEDYLVPNFVLPSTSIWRFADVKPYIDGQTLVCGKVNFQSSTHRYQGFHRFYAVFDHDRVTLAQIENAYADPGHRLSDKLDLICGKA